MGRWLAALRSDERKSEIATDANLQNPQNLPGKGFEGFEGSRSSPFGEIAASPVMGFEGFEGSSSEQIPNFDHLSDRSGWDEGDWQAAFDERAAILEFDEGLHRAEAARLARQQIDHQRRTKWH
jgi:hypothetical protein